MLLILTACGTTIDNTRWLAYSVGREYDRARSLLARGRTDEARRIFGNLRRLDPKNLGALYNEALLTTDAADRDTLKEELLSVIDSAPNPRIHAAYLAALSQITADRSRRESLLEKALEIEPESPLAHALLAMALEERGEFEEAYRHNLEAAKGSDPPPRVFRKLAAWLAKKGRRDDAIANYETYLIFEPDDEISLYNVGTLYLEEETWDRAEARLAAAFELNKQDLDITLNYARAAIENGRKQVAITLLDRARRLSPDEPVIYYNLGVYQAERLGDYEAAVANFKKYLELDGPEKRRVSSWIRELEEKLVE